MMFIVFVLTAATTISGAKPINLDSWFSGDDYPAAAWKKGIQGKVAFEVDVDPQGKPAACRVTGSSGSQVLDQTTCQIVMGKAKFSPAIASDGKAAGGQFSSEANWVLRSDPNATEAGDSTMGVQELAPGDFHCDAPAGDFFNHEIPPLPMRKPVIFRFKLITEHADPTWAEQAAIYFETPLGRRRIQVGKADNDPQHMYVALLDDKTGHSEIVDQYPFTNDWIELKLTLEETGTVQVESRGHRASLDVGTPWSVKTEIHCHSGAFEIQVLRPSN